MYKRSKHPVQRALATLRLHATWFRLGSRMEVLTKNHAGSGDPPHLGLLCGPFPPDVSGGVYRPLALARYAPANYWRLSVIAGKPPTEITPAGSYLLQHLAHTITVTRADPGECSESPLYRLSPKMDGGWPFAVALGKAAIRSWDSDRPDVLVATAPPFGVFHVAAKLANRYGCPLVLDYRDEWTVGTRVAIGVFDGDRNREAALLRKANGVVFVTRSIADMYMETFPEILGSKRIEVIRNGWDPLDFRSLPERAQAHNQQLNRIAYFGLLAPHKSPTGFLNVLKDVLISRPDLEARLRFRFVGQAHPEIAKSILSFPFQECIEFIPEYLDKPTVLRQMQESSALLVLNEPIFERTIPGKFYEYLASGTPLLVYGDTGEQASILRELGVGQIVPCDNPGALASALDLIMTGLPLTTTSSHVQDWLASHTREVMARRMFLLAKSVRHGGTPRFDQG